MPHISYPCVEEENHWKSEDFQDKRLELEALKRADPTTLWDAYRVAKFWALDSGNNQANRNWTPVYRNVVEEMNRRFEEAQVKDK